MAGSAHPARRVSVGIWLALCSAMVAMMILLGGATRLTDSGLSIVDWRPLTGFLPPLNDAEWAALFEAYKDSPEYRKENFWMTVDDFRSIYWLEYLHRLWGRVIGIFFFIPYLWFLIRGRLGDGLWWRLFGVFLLGGAQGVLGWYMVKSGLVDRTDVSQYRLAAHLALAVIIYGFLIAYTLRCLRPHDPARRKPMGFHAKLIVCWTLLTIIAGAFVAGIDAGLAYNTFPLMDGRLVPEGLLQLEPVWLNFFENTATVQFTHRVLGMTLVLLIILFWLRSRFGKILSPAAYRTIDMLCALALLQMALGVSALLTSVPLVLGLLHQAGAVALFTFAVWTVYELGAATVDRRPNRTAPNR